MPIPTNAAVLVAEWVKEKRIATKGAFGSREALFDFHMSYALTLIIAMCFIVMGTAILFETGRIVPRAAPDFAAELFGVFTQLIGEWMYPVIVSTALAVATAPPPGAAASSNRVVIASPASRTRATTSVVGRVSFLLARW